jgi:hypothetical protein
MRCVTEHIKEQTKTRDVHNLPRRILRGDILDAQI